MICVHVYVHMIFFKQNIYVWFVKICTLLIRYYDKILASSTYNDYTALKMKWISGSILVLMVTVAISLFFIVQVVWKTRSFTRHMLLLYCIWTAHQNYRDLIETS